MGVVESVSIDHSKVNRIYYIDKKTYEQIEDAYRNLLMQYIQLINNIIQDNNCDSKIYFWDRLKKAFNGLLKVFEELRKWKWK